MIESESFRPISPEIDYSGKYTDVELISITAHARLYRMRRAGRFFMAKTIREDSSKDVELLKREYELTLSLTHPHIVHIYAYETDTPVGPAIVMEYVDGRTLAEYLAEKPASSALQRVFEQLLTATDYLHKAGVIHNDLKPENILITRSNNDVRLIDFGFSDDDSHYMHRAQGGTRGYASPELAAQSHDLDTRSDVYSLGRIMQQLFPGRYRRIVHRCLHPDRARRHADVEALFRAWRHRHRPLQWTAMLVVAVLILLPTLLYIGERQQRIQYMHAMDSEKQLLDSLFRVIDTSYERHFQQTLDSIHAIDVASSENPYLTSMTMVKNYYDFTCRTKDEVIEIATDKAMQSQLESYANRLYTTYQTQLAEAASQWLPTHLDM
ncbi:MAG: serine/threonine protein kinase [Bacteroidaceae bacterium]|nr:serine/threonine protein kinase [Bacteroidaceae bacterium]